MCVSLTNSVRQTRQLYQHIPPEGDSEDPGPLHLFEQGMPGIWSARKE